MSDNDQGSKQTKNRLAVFEHLPCKDKSPPKNQNFRKRLNRALSPVSDTDLVVDDYDYCSTVSFVVVRRLVFVCTIVAAPEKEK